MIKEKLKQTWLFSKYKKVRKLLAKVKRRTRKFYLLRIAYPSIYKKYAKKPVDEKKVLFIEARYLEISNSFRVVYNELKDNYDFEIHDHFLGHLFVTEKEHVKRCKEMIKDLATAKYVFLNEASNIISCVPLREETKITQLWHGCGAFKKFGRSTADLIFGESRKMMDKYPYYKNYSYVTVSSPEVVWAYEEAMGIAPEENIVKPVGSSRTDVFFDDDYIQKAYDKLYDLLPQAKGKKVILYAPTFRGRVAKAKSPDCFGVEQFKESLGDAYVLIYKHHPLVKNPPVIPEECKEFAVDFTHTMTIDELLCVSDICISDYSSLVFEYSLFEKPMIFYAYDLDEYFDWRGFYYDYYELAPGPICNTNEEMIDYIKNIDTRFEKDKVVAFKKKFMESCDGHATQRILEMVMGEHLQQYKK